MKLSVVIPTYNRHDILQTCIERLAVSDFFKEDFEVIVVDDGSAEPVNPLGDFPFELTVLRQKNSGQGAARNRGIKQSKGDVVLIIGDDMFVTPDTIKEHMRIHEEHSEETVAVLGLIEWDPDSEVTEIMDFMTRGGAIFGRFGGHQFAFDRLEGKSEASYHYFYTSNISLKKSLLLRQPFDETLSVYGWEDIELGKRLADKEDLKIYYNKNAVTHHHHPVSDDGFAKRMKSIGKSARIVAERNPELGTLPSIKQRLVFRSLASRPIISVLKLFKKPGFARDLYFYALSKKYFLEGLTE